MYKSLEASILGAMADIDGMAMKIMLLSLKATGQGGIFKNQQKSLVIWQQIRDELKHKYKDLAIAALALSMVRLLS